MSAFSFCRDPPEVVAALGLLSLTHLWGAKVDAASLTLSSAPTSLWVVSVACLSESISPKSLKLKKAQEFIYGRKKTSTQLNAFL